MDLHSLNKRRERGEERAEIKAFHLGFVTFRFKFKYFHGQDVFTVACSPLCGSIPAPSFRILPLLFFLM